MTSRTRTPAAGADSFLIMPENRFAFTAISELGKRSDSPRAPIFLYGPSGTGKSHLATLASLFVGRWRRDPLIHRLLASEFAADFAEASDQQRIHEFRSRFDDAQLFICEDLHALEGRMESQQQLVTISDELQAQNCAILWTCRKSPGELNNFLPKLVNRFRSGVTAHMTLPSADSRLKLIEHFAKGRQMLIPDDAAKLLADALTVSPRELQATVLQLEARASQLRHPIDTRLARGLLQQDPPAQKITLEEITRAVAKQFGVSTKELRSRTRSQSVVVPRQCAMWLARELTQDSLQRIGKFFGDRDHSTVLHACGRVQTLLPDSPELRMQLTQVRGALGATGKALTERT